jgi:hypothetical protein
MPPQLIQLQQLKKDFMTDQLPKPETDTTGVTGPIPDDFPRDPFRQLCPVLSQSSSPGRLMAAML